MPSSIWPFDTLRELPPLRDDTAITSITCFVASPFKPTERWDDLLALIKHVARLIAADLRIPINCQRADEISSAGFIQAEIWQAIRDADIIICDVTGQNGNVMMELGVAATIRRKESIIILRETDDERPHLFDISPARHIEYCRSFEGYQKLVRDLGNAMAHCLATIPFTPLPPRIVPLPFEARLDDGRDRPELYTPDITHRCVLVDCLEFGAPLRYRWSWMSLGDLTVPNVRVRAEMTMRPPIGHPDFFMGVMVRGQSFFANYGYLTVVRENGNVTMSYPKDDSLAAREDVLGNLGPVSLGQFSSFDVAIDDHALHVKVTSGDQSVEARRSVADLPYLFTTGRVVFIAAFCRAGIRDIAIERI